MGKFLSAIAITMLLTGVWIAPAGATGTNSIQQISEGVNMVGETIRSTEVTGTIGWIALAFLGLTLLIGHFAGGFVGIFVGLVGLGFWFGSQQIAESIGLTAIGF